MSRLLPLLTITLAIIGCAFADDYSGPWRQSFNSCWLDRSCERVMTISHGGDWNLANPCDSQAAFTRAYDHGADMIKGSFRVSKDNIGVVMHSSPIEAYESLNCYNKKVEEMTAAECTQCKMEITDYTFTTVPDMLAWSAGRATAMFCVKRSEDIPRAITTLIDNNATDRAVLEIHVNDLLALPTGNTPHWDEVFYIADMKAPEDLNAMLAAPAALQKRVFLLEFNIDEGWPDVTTAVATAEAAGFRTVGVTKDKGMLATVPNHLDLFAKGFDVAYTYNLTNAVTARIQVNTANGISPP